MSKDAVSEVRGYFSIQTGPIRTSRVSSSTRRQIETVSEPQVFVEYDSETQTTRLVSNDPQIGFTDAFGQRRKWYIRYSADFRTVSWEAVIAEAESRIATELSALSPAPALPLPLAVAAGAAAALIRNPTVTRRFWA